MKYKLIYFLLVASPIFFVFEACQNQQDINYARYYTTGKALYEQHCQNCHGAEGQGLEDLIPPLTDTVFLKDHQDQLACIIRHGLSDSIVVNGKVYKEQMPGNHQLPELDIAAIVTYITNSFGNKQGLYDVSNGSGHLKSCTH